MATFAKNCGHDSPSGVTYQINLKDSNAQFVFCPDCTWSITDLVGTIKPEVELLEVSPIRCKYHGDYGDSGVLWAVYPPKLSNDEISQMWEDTAGEWYGRDCGPHAGDCCGRIFKRSAWIQRRGSRALVTQSWGRDI